MSILKDRYQKGSPGHALHLGTSIIGIIGVAMVVQICYQYFYFSPSDNVFVIIIDPIYRNYECRIMIHFYFFDMISQST